MADEENTVPTLDEYEAFISEVVSKPSIPYALEWSYAATAGWNRKEFERLYADYVLSTQISLNPKDNATEIKGEPLEKLVHYFLEKGGVVTSIKPISEPQTWQVDGQGPLNKTSILMCWGENMCQKSGFQLYMEAKNHINPMTSDEFSAHFRRMQEHGCNVGVSVSTSGFHITHGKGIAQSIHHNYLQNRFHLLLVFESFRSVIVDRKAPLFVLTEVLNYAANNNYYNDRDVQRIYTKNSCYEIAQTEYKRLFCNSQMKA
jgi:hypothetical protein